MNEIAISVLRVKSVTESGAVFNGFLCTHQQTSRVIMRFIRNQELNCRGIHVDGGPTECHS